MAQSKTMDEALKYLDASSVTREEWISVGMALKAEGYDVAVWDSWSSTDAFRYHNGECQKKWNSFRSSGINGGTLVQIAKKYGFTSSGSTSHFIDWDGYIEYDGDIHTIPEEEWNPSDQIKTYLNLLYEDEDYVGYVTNDVNEIEGKYVPGSKGVYWKTKADIIKELDKHPEDISYAVESVNENAGAWIRFNALDGNGVANSNVTKFKYALVESDTMPIPEQDTKYRLLQLPIRVLVHSGGKSLHAIVKIDAQNEDEYRQRVDFLYDYLQKNGVSVDKQNRNPSRLSRMPGVVRGTNKQYIVATDIGKESWREWERFATGKNSSLPKMETLNDYIADLNDRVELPESLIDGLLRVNHKMVLTGASKAGKTFALIELGLALATGNEFLGFPCKKSKVVYLNMEVDKNSFMNRVQGVCVRKGLDYETVCQNFGVFPMRGEVMSLEQVVDGLIEEKESGLDFSVVILDPAYKVMMGDENNASDMARFCNQFDRLCTKANCALIFCHHHSKGSQGQKKAMDRSSGSGVFARDPDAIIDMIELVLDNNAKFYAAEQNAYPLRIEATLREFKPFKPIDVWLSFDDNGYGIHEVDKTGLLANCGPSGTPEGNLKRGSNRVDEEDALECISIAYESNIPYRDEHGEYITLANVMSYLNVGESTVRRYVAKCSDNFEFLDRKIYKK